jgi:hypothetical protein
MLSSALNHVPRFENIDDALLATRPDMVLNAANNEGHIEVIRALQYHPDVKGFLGEKPLVGDERDEAEAHDHLRGRFVSMNMVTNFSEAVSDLRAWIGNNPQIELVGIDAVWGKDRTNDMRPTPGIVNDIVHPVGLIQAIYGVDQWNLQDRAKGHQGVLSIDRDGKTVDCVYHYRAAFHTNAAPVRLDCSFGWKDQVRRVSAFYKDKEGQYYATDLFLDEPEKENPKKRSDFFEVWKLSDGLRPEKLLHRSNPSSADKLERFVLSSVKGFRSGTPEARAGLVGLKEEVTLGKVFGLLHPSDFKAAKHLRIESVPVAEDTKVPDFSPLGYASTRELKERIDTLAAMRTESGAQRAPDQALAPRL